MGKCPHIGTGKVSTDVSDWTSLCVIAYHQLNTSMHDYHIAMLLPMEWSSCSLRNLLVHRAVALYEWVGHKGGLLPSAGKLRIPISNKIINTTCSYIRKLNIVEPV